MADPVGFALNIAIQAAISLIIAALRPKQNIEGPRLDDTSVSSAAYGKTIPIGYGTDIVAGNIIWGKEIEEVAKEYDIGKGNPFSLGTRTEYKYFLTCAVGISQREVKDLIGIYADGKLIYDAEAIDGKASGNLHPFLDNVPESQQVTDKGNEKAPPIINNLEFNFYPGSLSQEQDPIMAEDVGSAACPAYRGLSYIVFNRMPLKDLGNRVPQFRFVVAWTPPDESELSFRQLGSSDDVNVVTTANYPFTYDRDAEIIYSVKRGTNGIPGQTEAYYLEAVSAQTGEQLAFNFQLGFEYVTQVIGGMEITNSVSAIDFMVGAQGPLLVMRGATDGLGFHTPMVFYDKETLEPVAKTGTNAENQAIVDPDGDDLPTIQSSWTVPITRAVNFTGGHQTVAVPSLQGARHYVIGGPPHNSYGASGTHLHSLAVLSANTSNAGIITYFENMAEPTFDVVNGIDEWRYGLSSGPTGGFYFGYGFIGVIQGRTVDIGSIEVFIMMGLDPDGPIEGFTMHLATLNAGGALEYSGLSWRVEDFGSPVFGGSARPNVSYIAEDNTLIFIGPDLWRAVDVDRDAINANGGEPPVIWERTDILGMGRVMDTYNLRPDGNCLIGRDSLSPTSSGIWRSVDVTTGQIINTFIAPEFTQGDGLNTNYAPSVFECGRSRGLVMVELTGSETVFGWQYYEPALSRPSERLDLVVSDIVTRGKLTASDIDVTDLATQSVRGYVIGRDTTYRKALEPLQTAYNFIGVERDGKIVFEFKGGDADIVVPEDDLVRSSRENIFEEERKDEVTVPRMVFVSYRSTNLKDERATQHARQITDTYLTIGAQGDVTTELPLVLSDQEGREVAERMLYESRLSLDNFKFTLPSQYLRVTPGDVLQVTAAGRLEDIRALEVSVGFDLEVQIEGTLVDGDVYSPNITAARTPIAYGSPNFTPGNVDIQPAPSVLGFLLDLPPIRYDLVSTLARTAGTYMGFVVGLPPVYSGNRFVGGGLQVSYTEGSDYSTRSTTSAEMSYGVVQGSVPDMPGIDWNGVQDAYIDINVGGGAENFVSVTQAQMIGESANVAILHSPSRNILEIIRFKTVTERTSGTGRAQLRLSGLMRGQRGTNTEALRWASEAPGVTYLILASETTLNVFTEPLSRLGDTVRYRTAPAGVEDPVNLRTTDLTYQLRGLKPFTIAHPRMRLDNSGGDRLITWERRTRGEGAWRNSTGTIELEEDSESYQIDFLDAQGGSIVFQSGASEPLLEVSEELLDFHYGSNIPDPLWVRIYQVSRQVNVGYPYEVGLTLED